MKRKRSDVIIGEEMKNLMKKKRRANRSGNKARKRLAERMIRTYNRNRRKSELEAKLRQVNQTAENLGLPPSLKTVSETFGKKAPKESNTISIPLTGKDENGNTITATKTTEKTKLHQEFCDTTFRKLVEVPLAPKNGPNDKSTFLSIKEMDKNINEAKMRKAAAGSGMNAEMMIFLNPENRTLLYAIIGHIWNDERMPDKLNESIVAVLEKAGKDSGKVENWRPVALIELVVKVISRIIYNRLKEKYEATMSESQGGFRSNRRGTDNVLTLRLVQEFLKINKKTGFAFCALDLKQAFDSLKREFMFSVLHHYGIPEKEIRIIKALYENHTYTVRRDGKMHDKSSKSLRGVKQGCSLSPMLWNFCLNYLLSKANFGEGVNLVHCHNWKNMTGEEQEEITNNLDRSLTHLLFADDIVILAPNRDALEKVLTELNNLLLTYDLHIHPDKTEFLVHGIDAEVKVEPIKLPQGEVKRVTKLKYLGSIISDDGECKLDIDHKVGKANMAMKPFRKLFWAKKMQLKRKFNIFKTFIYSIILYGCESWTLKAPDRNTLDVWWRKQLRKLHNITLFDHVTNSKLYKAFETKPLTDLIEERRWRYFAHLYRYNEERWAKFILTAKLSGGKSFKQVGNRLTWQKSVKDIGHLIITKDINETFNFKMAGSKAGKDKSEWNGNLIALKNLLELEKKADKFRENRMKSVVFLNWKKVRIADKFRRCKLKKDVFLNWKKIWEDSRNPIYIN